MKHIAPVVLGPLEFEGLKNELILIEVDQDSETCDLLRQSLSGKLTLIFSPSIDVRLDKNYDEYSYSVVVRADSVYQIFNYLKDMQARLEFIVVDRLDMMDTELSPKERGAQQAAFLQMLAMPSRLKKGNIIVTSSNSEDGLKKKCDRYLYLKTR